MVLARRNRRSGRRSLKPWSGSHVIILVLLTVSALFAILILDMNATVPSADLLSPPLESSRQISSLLVDVNASNASDNVKWYERTQPLLSDWPKLEKRLDVIPILEQLKLKRGIEVGVQKGILAKKSLQIWRSCEEYKLVDLWGREDGYVEPGNHKAGVKESWLHMTKIRLAKWTEKGVTELFIMRSTDAAKKLKDNYFDYIYLDARHDYCAVKEDIEHYYPKLRPGGILGGHDYIDAQYAIDRLGKKEDWSVCEDGSKHPEAVKGAVDDFVKANGLIVITSNESFPSWYLQKPYE